MWDPWTPCSVSCGWGRFARIRTCRGDGCTGRRQDRRSCYKRSCPGKSCLMHVSLLAVSGRLSTFIVVIVIQNLTYGDYGVTGPGVHLPVVLAASSGRENVTRDCVRESSESENYVSEDNVSYFDHRHSCADI